MQVNVKFIVLMVFLIQLIDGGEYIKLNVTSSLINDIYVGFGNNSTITHQICSVGHCRTSTIVIATSLSYSANIEGVYDHSWSVTYISAQAIVGNLCESGDFDASDNLFQKNIQRQCGTTNYVLSYETSIPPGWTVPPISVSSSPSQSYSRSPSVSISNTRTPSQSYSPSTTRTPSAPPSICGMETAIPKALSETGLQVLCDSETQAWVVNGSFVLNTTLDTVQPVEVLGNLTLTNLSQLELTNPKGLIVRGCIELDGRLVISLENEVEGNITLKDIITWNCTLKENNQNFESISVQYVKEDECIDSFPESDYGTYSLSVVISGQKNQRNSCFEAESSDNTNVGAIVGGVVGGVLFLVCVVIVVILIVFLVKKIHKRSMKDDNHGKAILF
eukprot:TRINITY_DN2531_c0_g2_i1.p1 TRINITY_DN2531_c0_g2~~TRINITY_DN2531_c0_g2_i1.p1  ORF type:complete len:390 (+),score=51.65 TRINITY_DN2531_c0_g2_i1:135-1304(+)